MNRTSLSIVHRGMLLVAATHVAVAAVPVAPEVGVGTRLDDWVEGTQALDDGASRDDHNAGGHLAWENFLGDWADATGVSQGEVPFASVAMVDDDTWEYIEWDVTALVQQWVDGVVPNQGFLVRLTSGNSTYYFRPREHTVPEERPELVVVTAAETLTVAPQADTYVAASTYQTLGDADILRVSDDENALLRFDLDSVRPRTRLTSATLRLFVFGEFGSSEVGIYRSSQGHAEPPTPPTLGLAAHSLRDRGLQRHPDVFFFEGFESEDWTDRWSVVDPGVVDNYQRVTDDPERVFEPLQGHALRVRIPDGELEGMDVRYRFVDELGYEPEEIYFRYYLRFADDWQTLDGGKLPGPAGTYGVAGWGGRRSDGTNGWSARGTFEEVIPAGNTLADRVPIGNYVYHAEQATSFGDVHLWQNDYRGYLDKNRWYCIEQHLRLNTPGANDGVLRTWVDGRLAWEKTDWRWRDVDSLKIETIWMNVYHGGTTPIDRDVHLYVDNVVIARRYVGPRR